jgi:hypothetical protein
MSTGFGSTAKKRSHRLSNQFLVEISQYDLGRKHYEFAAQSARIAKYERENWLGCLIYDARSRGCDVRLEVDGVYIDGRLVHRFESESVEPIA